jgi:hypothetical protein
MVILEEGAYANVSRDLCIIGLVRLPRHGTGSIAYGTTVCLWANMSEFRRSSMATRDPRCGCDWNCAPKPEHPADRDSQKQSQGLREFGAKWKPDSGSKRCQKSQANRDVSLQPDEMTGKSERTVKAICPRRPRVRALCPGRPVDNPAVGPHNKRIVYVCPTGAALSVARDGTPRLQTEPALAVGSTNNNCTQKL